MTKTLQHYADLQALVKEWRGQGKTIGFVPTMGALHAGHAALVRLAKKQCDKVIVSIFVNPLQFGENEDYDKYPRQESQDTAFLTTEKVDAVYLPTMEALYPEGYSVTLDVHKWSDILCAITRPRHFDGVATVVSKFLHQIMPDKAYFGEKDYQQLCVVKLLTRELFLPIEIVGVPIVREADGLALSSRNAYLSEPERRIAPSLYETMVMVGSKTKGGRSPIYYLLKEGKRLLLSRGFTKVDYLEVRDSETLDEVTNTVLRPARLLAAAYIGHTRLIDNIEILP